VSDWLLKANTDHEKQVLQVILEAGGKITQTKIAKKVFIGKHPIYEENVWLKERDSTERHVRAVIRSLRVSCNIPVLSDDAGYWVSTDMDEGRACVERMRGEVQMRIKSSLETVKAMAQMFEEASRCCSDRKVK